MFQDKWGRILFAIIAIAIVLSSVPQLSLIHIWSAGHANDNGTVSVLSISDQMAV